MSSRRISRICPNTAMVSNSIGCQQCSPPPCTNSSMSGNRDSHPYNRDIKRNPINIDVSFAGASTYPSVYKYSSSLSVSARSCHAAGQQIDSHCHWKPSRPAMLPCDRHCTAPHARGRLVKAHPQPIRPSSDLGVNVT